MSISIKSSLVSCSHTAVSAIAMCAFAGVANAATFVPLGSGVQAYFGSQSNAYTDSDPTGATWTAPGPGFWPAGAGLPGLGASPNPNTIPITFGNPFQTTPSTSIFADNLAGTTSFSAAQSTIGGSFNPSGTLTSDAEVNILNWRVAQGPAATGYAFEQMHFASDYGITNNLTGLGASTPAFPLPITGLVQPGGFGQFDAVIQYSWIPTTPTFIPTGPAVSLGSLSYGSTQGPGSFNTILFSTGALSASPTGDGILALTGHMWLAGDPFDFSVGVPEPTTLAFFALGGFSMLRRRKA